MTADRAEAIHGTINEILRPAGLTVRGAFTPRPDDGVPPLSDGTRVGTVLLVGNVGGDLWQAFAASPRDAAMTHPLEAWITPAIEQAAEAIGAVSLFAHRGPPYVPIQRWAQRAECVHQSPIGLLIHPVFGLWHAYRAALCLGEALVLPPPREKPSPCESCAEKPCLHTCPVKALGADGLDVTACTDHVTGPSGATCRIGGCLARRACPVGTDYRYPEAARTFHTAAFLNAVRGQTPPR